MKRISLLIFTLTLANLYSLEINDLYRSAYEVDGDLENLALNEKNRVIDWEIAELREGWKFSIGDNGSGGLLSFENESKQLSGKPELALNLPYPLKTEIKLSSPFSVNLNNGDGQVPLDLSVKQPLSSLLGIDNRSLIPELKNQRDKTGILFDIFLRQASIRGEILNLVHNAYTLERTIAENLYQIETEKFNLENDLELKKIAPGTSPYYKKELAIRKLERENKRKENELLIAYKKLEMQSHKNIAGKKLEGMKFSQEDLNTLVKYSGINPEIEKARMAEEISLRSLLESKKGKDPDLNLTGSYELKEPKGDSENILKGGISAGFEDFSFSTSLQGSIGKDNLSLGLGFKWTTPDNRKKRLDVERKENELFQSRLGREKAEKSLRENLSLIEQELENLKMRTLAWEDDSQLAALNLSDTEQWYKAGYVTAKELKDAHFEQSKVDRERDLLILSRMIVANKLEKMYYTPVL